MKNTRKSAFILNECNSPYIAQAIFILREGVRPEEGGVLADAERIVAAYMSGGTRQKPQKKHLSPTALYVLSSAAVLVFALAACVYFLI